MRADERLVRLVSSRLRERGLTLRELARQAGVSHSSISRLLGGRSRATPALLRALAAPLGCTAGELLHAAGLAPAQGDMWELLRALGLDPAPPELVTHVEEQLARLREYAATEEAAALAREGLERKVEALGARGPVVERLRALARLYLAGAAPGPERLAAGAAVLYFLHATDAIDDFLFPVGYLDDAVAVALAEAAVRQLRAARPTGPEGAAGPDARSGGQGRRGPDR